MMQSKYKIGSYYLFECRFAVLSLIFCPLHFKDTDSSCEAYQMSRNH